MIEDEDMISLLQRQLLSLIRSSVFHAAADEYLFTTVQWPELMALAKDQTVQGVAVDGMQRLPEELRPDLKSRLKWVGWVYTLEHRNRQMNDEIAIVYDLLHEAGVKTAFMKGQITASRYPKPLLRQCGDVDFVVSRSEFDQARSVFERLGCKDAMSAPEHHADYDYHGICWELHHKIHNFQWVGNDRAMESLFDEMWQEDALKPVMLTTNQGLKAVCGLPPEFDLTFQTAHVVHHIYSEGLGLRQLVDFAVCLNVYLPQLNMTLLESHLNRLNVYHAFEVLCYVAEHYLGMPHHAISWEKKQRVMQDGDRLMQDVMRVGNFGRAAYTFKRGEWCGEWQNYLYVCGRSLKFFGLCKTEAVMWPASKLLRFWWKRKVTK